MGTSLKSRPPKGQDFLILGYGDENCGTASVGPLVAKAVSQWQLPSVKSLAVPQLTPELSHELAQASYVIFIDACGHPGIRTVQIDPLVAYERGPFSMAFAAHSYDPLALLNLTQRLYGHHPQSWLFQIPIRGCDLNQQISRTAHRGYDHALRTIEQFLVTYQHPQVLQTA